MQMFRGKKKDRQKYSKTILRRNIAIAKTCWGYGSHPRQYILFVWFPLKSKLDPWLQKN